jgi:hypothetical protein
MHWAMGRRRVAVRYGVQCDIAAAQILYRCAHLRREFRKHRVHDQHALIADRNGDVAAESE